MFSAGIEVTDADSAMAAADVAHEDEAVESPGCHGARSIYDLSHEFGWINAECPCCGGWGTIEVTADGSDGWDDPEPPTPAAPALALVVPSHRCAACKDTGRLAKPSAWFPGWTMLGFCPDRTPHIDVATGRYLRSAA